MIPVTNLEHSQAARHSLRQPEHHISPVSIQDHDLIAETMILKQLKIPILHTKS